MGKPSFRFILWLLPLALALFPCVMAWRWTTEVPHADHWGMVAQPYFAWLDGEPLWKVIHTQFNDGRYDLSTLCSLVIVKFTHWNLRIESLVCVAIACATALLVLQSMKRLQPCGERGSWWLALLCVALMLSPHQWMNWTFGVQICYMLVVFFTMATVAVTRSGLSLTWRAFLGGMFAALASHCFINGWLAWVLGGAALAFECFTLPVSRRDKAIALGVFGTLCGLTALVYFPGFRFGASVSDDPGTVFAQLAAKPVGVVTFFLSLLGALFGTGWPSLDRERRNAVLESLSPVLGVVSLLIFVALLTSFLRHRARWDLRRTLGAWLFVFWGLANAAAISLGRTGNVASSAFQSRYHAFTMWFHIGVLALLFLAQGKTWRVLRGFWLPVVCYGWLTGFAQGLADARRDYNRGENMKSACAFRHVAPEPAILDEMCPGRSRTIIAMLDRLQSLGCLDCPHIGNEEVSKAKIIPGDAGILEHYEKTENGVLLDGWAVDPLRRDVVNCVVISVQPEGAPECWLGIAQKRHPRMNVARRHAPNAMDGRIGWSYRTPTGNEKVMFSNKPIELKPKPLPPGRVVFRAYAFNNDTGELIRLRGEIVRE